MSIAFIGLGKIGNPMAMNLLKAGFTLTVHDLRRERADPLIAKGALWADDAAAAAACDTVITSLPGPPEIRAVVTGERGLIAGLRRGGCWIDMSTNAPAELRGLAAMLAQNGVATLDSPVTGGVANARQGRVTMFVGGERADFERQLPVFNGIGDKVFHMGPLGSGMVTKLITNMLAFIHQVGLGEGLMLGARAGLDLATLREAIIASYGSSFVAVHDAPMILDGSYDPSFALDLVCKDLGLVSELGREVEVPLELAAHVARIFGRARERYGGESGILQVVKLLEEATGTALRAPARQ